jgi:hypothetical protein
VINQAKKENPVEDKNDKEDKNPNIKKDDKQEN